MENTRINLTLPAPVDGLLAEMARITGQSKSGLIASILTLQMPRLRQWIDAYQGDASMVGLSGMDLQDAPSAPATRADGPGRLNTAGKRSEVAQRELTRQERRALERQEAKEKRRRS